MKRKVQGFVDEPTHLAGEPAMSQAAECTLERKAAKSIYGITLASKLRGKGELEVTMASGFANDPRPEWGASSRSSSPPVAKASLPKKFAKPRNSTC